MKRRMNILNGNALRIIVIRLRKVIVIVMKPEKAFTVDFSKSGGGLNQLGLDCQADKEYSHYQKNYFTGHNKIYGKEPELDLIFRCSFSYIHCIKRTV